MIKKLKQKQELSLIEFNLKRKRNGNRKERRSQENQQVGRFIGKITSRREIGNTKKALIVSAIYTNVLYLCFFLLFVRSIFKFTILINWSTIFLGLFFNKIVLLLMLANRQPEFSRKQVSQYLNMLATLQISMQLRMLGCQ
jgi:hypothetical protein